MTYKQAVNILFEETPTDYILEYFETPDCFQFNVSCGGDLCRYRVYKETGKVVEK